MLKVRWTLGSQVDDDVDDRSASHCNDLRICGWRELEVHSPQRAFALTEQNVRLSDHGIQAVFRELTLAKGPRKEAPIVLAAFELKYERTLEFGLDKSHPVFRLALMIFGHRA